MLIINSLFSSLHLLINSQRFLSIVSGYGTLIIKNDFIKLNRQKLSLKFPQTFLKIFHFIIEAILFLFSSHACFESSVALIYLAFLPSLTWLLINPLFIIQIAGGIYLVNNVWCKALLSKRVLGINSATATLIGFWWNENRAVKCRYNGVHITHATITYLN